MLDNTADITDTKAPRRRSAIDTEAGTVTVRTADRASISTFSVDALSMTVRTWLLLNGLRHYLNQAENPVFAFELLAEGTMPERRRAEPKAEKPLSPWRQAIVLALLDAAVAAGSPLSEEDARRHAEAFSGKRLGQAKREPAVMAHHAALTRPDSSGLLSLIQG